MELTSRNTYFNSCQADKAAAAIIGLIFFAAHCSASYNANSQTSALSCSLTTARHMGRHCHFSNSCNAIMGAVHSRKGKEKTTNVGVDLIRSQVSCQAAQGLSFQSV